MNKLFKLCVLSFVSIFGVSGAYAASNAMLTIESNNNCAVDQTCTIAVTAKAKDGVAGPINVAGAAFTITHDLPDTATVTIVNGSFFDTFVNQGFTQGEDGLDANGFVDSYDAPFVTNGLAIAGARTTASDVSAGVTLFSLDIENTQEGGPYTLNIQATNLNNTNAGYDAAGENIDMLIGADATKEPTDPTAFPVVLAVGDVANSVTAGQVIFSVAVDTDSDGIDDAWETQYFGDLTTATATSDSDGDGLTDLEEFGSSFALDPTKADTDSDGFNDKVEVDSGSDPTNVDDVPSITNNGDLVEPFGTVDLNDVQSQFTMLLLGSGTAEQRAIANVCNADDLTIDDVQALFLKVLLGTPTVNCSK